MKVVLVFLMIAAASHGTVIGPSVSPDGSVMTGAKVQLTGDGNGQTVITPDTVAHVKGDGASDAVISGPQTAIGGGTTGQLSTPQRTLSSKDGVMTMTGPQGTLTMNN